MTKPERVGEKNTKLWKWLNQENHIGSFPLSVRQPRQDFPFKSQPASHGVCLIIEAEGKIRAETGHRNCHCSSKPN